MTSLQSENDFSIDDAVFDYARHASYSGRLDWQQAEGPILSWAGSSIAVRIAAAAVQFRLTCVERTDTWFDLIVDGVVVGQRHIEPQGVTVIAIEGLSSGQPHTVALNKRTEAMFGTVRFLSCELPSGGRFLAPPPKPERRIEIIGDSISAGSGNEGIDGEPNIAAHENSSLAYGTLAAKALSADVRLTAISGIGLVVNYGDERVNTMPEQYWRLNPLHSDSRYDTAEWTPAVVVVNLGTNDSAYEVAEEVFKQTYAAFAARLREAYPQAQLVLSLGPFAQEPIRYYIEEVVQELRRKGDDRVSYLLFDRMDRELDGMGETGHPNVITHAKMAKQLTEALQSIMGWQ